MLPKASVAGAQTVVLEVELEWCACRVTSASDPSHLILLQVKQVPEKDRFALEQIEAVAGEASALSYNHPFGSSLRNFDVGGEVV